MASSDDRKTAGILIETEMFDDFGGWELDTQFAPQMGSAYLIAHGMGEPVSDAKTRTDVDAGTYKVWVRAKDWVPGYHPGRFQVLFNGEPLPCVLGENDKDWEWQDAGTVTLPGGSNEISLHDLTGFDGRIDAIYLARNGEVPPEQGLNVNRAWRKSLLGIPDSPENQGEFDVVVVGGGVPGCSAAISAARNGLKVALVHDRPVLGGNASSEVGLGPRGYKTKFVEQLIERKEDGNLGCTEMVEAEPNISVFLNEHMCSLLKSGDRISSIETRNLITSAESVFKAETFIDASGTGALAVASGAECRTGREGKSEFGEGLAPDEPDEMHHGNTLLFHLGMSDHPVDYGDIPWATEISKDFSCLSGQMGALSEDNQPGPCAVEPDPEELPKLAQKAKHDMVEGIMKNHMFPPEEVIHIFPATHFWEYGQFLDMEKPGNEELVRDHLLRALYGTMANIKKAQPEKYANLQFEWLHIVPARGEYRRIIGDYILNENDVREHAEFPDAIVKNDEAFCLHYPGDEKYDFRLAKWIWDVRDQKPYDIPFRCLYSKNVPNLMMAGKHISVSRVVSSSVKMMANGAEHGVAVGCAAALCKKYGETPREVGAEHFEELKDLADKINEG